MCTDCDSIEDPHTARPQDGDVPTIGQVLEELDTAREARQALATKFRKLSELVTLIDESIATIVSTPHDYTMIHGTEPSYLGGDSVKRHWHVGTSESLWIMITAEGTLAYVRNDPLARWTLELELHNLTIEQIDFIAERITEMAIPTN
jgi:hypothetical protein